MTEQEASKKVEAKTIYDTLLKEMNKAQNEADLLLSKTGFARKMKKRLSEKEKPSKSKKSF